MQQEFAGSKSSAGGGGLEGVREERGLQPNTGVRGGISTPGPALKGGGATGPGFCATHTFSSEKLASPKALAQVFQNMRPF